MKINCKLLLITVIASCFLSSTFAVPKKTSTTQDNFNNINVLHQQTHAHNTIKTDITNSIPNNSNEDIAERKNITEQLYNRFVEKTEFNKIKTINGKSIENIKQEIQSLNDGKLNEDGLKDYPELLKFIATGSLSYGEMNPDTAFEMYNSQVEKKLKLTEQQIDIDRQQDIKEIEDRENLQLLVQELSEINQRHDNNLDPSTGEIMQYLSSELLKSNDTQLWNALMDLYRGTNNNEIKYMRPPTQEEINELKKAIDERSREKISVKLKKFIGNIKNLFNQSKHNNQSNDTKQNNVNESDVKTNTINVLENKQLIQSMSSNDENNKPSSILSNKLTKDEAVELMMENNALLN